MQYRPQFFRLPASWLTFFLWCVALPCFTVQAGEMHNTPAGQATVAPPQMRPLKAGSNKAWDNAYLRSHLPTDAFFYARLPSVRGLLGAPKGNMFDDALSSAAYMDALLSIRTGLLENVIPELPLEARGLAELLLAHIRSPLEIAMLPPSQPDKGLPQILASATLESGVPADANALLGKLLKQMPKSKLQVPISDDGRGLLVVSGLPFEVYLDSDNRRLFLGLADVSGQLPKLPERLASLPTQDENHPMRDTESALDDSGQGLYLWLAPNPLMKVMETMGKAREVALLRAFGASEAKAIAFGIGGSGGKQRIKMVLEMPQIGFRGLIPVIETDLPLRTAGEPDALVMLGLPGPDDMRMLEANLRGVMSPKDFKAYEKAKAAFAEKLGFEPEMLLGAFGDELAVVFDDAGQYLALRLRDPNLYRQILKQSVEGSRLVHDTRELLGTRFHHLTLPSLSTAPPQAKAGESRDNPLERRFLDAPNHLYWIERDGYLLLANTPQTLMDYLYAKNHTPVAEWLRGKQGVDPAGALLLASTRSKGVPQMMHQVNLQLLAYLGDVVGRPVDLFALPSARELRLPGTGAFSFALDSSQRQLGMELVYESNPVEALLHFGAMNSAAVGGILAAIAIPAYHDYSIRAKVAQGSVELRGLKRQLARFYAKNGRFPNPDEAKGALARSKAAASNMELVLEPDTGVLSATFKIKGLGKGSNSATFTPDTSGGSVKWQCKANMKAKYLPAIGCR